MPVKWPIKKPPAKGFGPTWGDAKKIAGTWG